MELSELSKEIEHLPEKEKNAILALIDLKSRSDMEKVLNRLDAIASKFESKFSAIESKFESNFNAIDSKFNAIESKFESNFNAIDSKFNAIESKFSILLWVISAIGVMIAVFKFIK